jgi:hypothetical protein
VSVTVPVDDVPTGTVVGFNVSDANEATETVRVVVLVVPYTAVIVTEVEDATPLVVIVKVALLEPAPMATLAGT